MINLFALDGIGEVKPDDDLAGLLANAIEHTLSRLIADDVVCVTQKIVSKAEGRYVDLDQVHPSPDAVDLAGRCGKDPRLIEVVLGESLEIVRVAPGVLITRHRLGFVMANAGVDQSNLGTGRLGQVLLLPNDPDASAAGLREALGRRFGIAPGVVITDSFGRPWRNGVLNVAIGAAGVASLVDRRGDKDRDGRTLQVTEIAHADAIAAAAGLLTGEADEGIPAVLMRGVPSPSIEPQPSKSLIRARERERDLFR